MEIDLKYISVVQSPVSAVVAGLNAAKISAEAKQPEEAKSEDLSALSPEEKQKQVKKRNKLLRQIEELETKQKNGDEMSADQLAKIERKQTILEELKVLG